MELVPAWAAVPARAPTKHGAMAEARMALREMGMGVSLVGGGNECRRQITAVTSLLISGNRKRERTRRGGEAKVKWSCPASRREKRPPNRVRRRSPPRPVELGAGPLRPAGAQRGDICKTPA